ncbi:MAG: lipase family alpha/beta hydrolase [Gammaproteobacteria bacterium]
MKFSLKARLLFYRWTFGLLVVALAFYAGSWYTGHKAAPDLKRLYMQSMMVTDQPPVVFIHGVMGGKLRDTKTGEELWIGDYTRVVTSDYSDLSLKIDPDTLEPVVDGIESFDVADGIFGKDFYGRIVRTLHDIGGYKLARPGDKIVNTEKNYYVFFYDWRQDNVLSASRLADFIEQIRVDYGNPNLKVDIVAHSMGGLITRYYIRYGREDVLNSNDFPVNMYGGKRVRRVILLGTPNLGSISILNFFIDGIKVGGTEKIKTETMATMPSLYQLFPHPLNNWIVTSKGKPLDRDLFDVNIWRRFQWSIFNPSVRERIRGKFADGKDADLYLATLEKYFEKRLERARRFVWSLTVPLPEKHPKLIVFGGGCDLTPARIVVEEFEGDSLIRMYPDQITKPEPGVDYNALLLEPGDGSVTKASLLGRDVLDPSIPRHKYSFFPLDHAFIMCEKHDSLTGNLTFQDNLLNELLSRD